MMTFIYFTQIYYQGNFYDEISSFVPPLQEFKPIWQLDRILLLLKLLTVTILSKIIFDYLALIACETLFCVLPSGQLRSSSI